MSKSVFETLSKISVNEHTEKKNGLTYLSWAWAWSVTKENYPKANYTIYENDLGFNYHTDGITCWVKVGVEIEEQEHIEYLPVMNYKNQSIPKDQVTSFNVNTAIQRALTKAIARHGLGLYIYAGEDLPNDAEEKPVIKKYKTASQANEGERKEYRLEFYKRASVYGFEQSMFIDFLDFLGIEKTNSNAIHNATSKFLGSEEYLSDQVSMYIEYKRKQNA